MLTTMARGRMKMLLGYAVGMFGSRIMRSRKGTPSSRCISSLLASSTELRPGRQGAGWTRARQVTGLHTC